MRTHRLLLGSLFIGGCLGVSPAVHAIDKANNTTNLNSGSSWTGGNTPGVFDQARWTSTVDAGTAASAFVLGGNVSWGGISITNPGGAITIGAGSTITVGNQGINLSAATQNLTISSGLTVIANNDQVWNVASGRTLALNTGTFTRQGGATVNVRGSGTVTTSNISNDATGLIGAWATFGTGTSTRYATVSGGSIAGFTGTPAATAAAMIDTTGAANYELAAGGAVGPGASFHTLRYTGGADAVTGAVQADGILNVGSGALSFSGDVTIGATAELVINTASADVSLSGALNNHSSGASSLIKVGSSTLTLSGAGNYTGMTVVNGGVLDVGTISNGSLGSGGLFLNGDAVLQGNGTFTRSLSGNATPGAGQMASQYGGFAARGGTLTVNFGGAGALFDLNGSGYRFGNNLVFGSASADSKVIVVNPINLNTGGQRAITVNSGVGGDSAELQGVLSDGSTGFFPSGFVKNGTGLLILTAANTYTGVTRINAGTVSISSIADGGVNSNLGASSTAASNLVLAGGALQYTGATASSNRNFTIAAGTTGTIAVPNTATNLTLSGSAASGSGALTKAGPGTLTLRGTNLNTGLTTINGGVLDVGTISAGSLGSGGLLIANDSILQGNGTFTYAFSGSSTPGTGQLAGQNGGFAAKGGTLTLNFGGAAATIGLNTSLYIFGNRFVFGSAEADSKVIVVNPINLNSNGGNRIFVINSGLGGDSTELQGELSQTTGQVSGLTKTGTGTLILTATNTYTGATNVSAGKLVVSGSISAASTTNVSAGADPGTLASGNNLTSLVGSVSVSSDGSGGGTLAPGDTGGSAATSIGKLNIDGTLALGGGATAGKAHLALELGGTTAGSLYDQVSTTGNVSLNSVNLDLSLVNGYAATIALNDTFTIILNGGVGALTGTFANAPGNEISVGLVTFSVDYGFNADAGGIGNDVVLTVTAVPEPTSAALLAGGLGLFLGLRRRDRRRA